ncbi:hypothetical protein NEOLI_002208 [Neolecta irregularis DAH-3]|uniref:Uncharacterized protein n=1 Tax=Neolecta irregularis (strain DAH-3) TaxID=1198029 RepID=A0A1U7LTA7_NEOID|nr:hypothetical protein NEOLI_002208 [Neolecta irregularis DAH-3]|eukprot:OLL25900.1 hypothetical protein NEOLI_002208 [Neolecta irregularis DAH-3]
MTDEFLNQHQSVQTDKSNQDPTNPPPPPSSLPDFKLPSSWKIPPQKQDTLEMIIETAKRMSNGREVPIATSSRHNIVKNPLGKIFDGLGEEQESKKKLKSDTDWVDEPEPIKTAEVKPLPQSPNKQQDNSTSVRPKLVPSLNTASIKSKLPKEELPDMHSIMTARRQSMTARRQSVKEQVDDKAVESEKVNGDVVESKVTNDTSDEGSSDDEDDEDDDGWLSD